MQSLEGACEEGERTIKRLKTCRPSLPLLHPQEPEEPVTPPSNFCIFTKGLEVHREESVKDTNIAENRIGLRRNSHILEKLVAKERLNTFILNLYPGNKGYSLAFRMTSRSNTNQNPDDTANMIETKQWPYEEDELLRYIDNEELPPYLIDMFEAHYSFLFYNGCVIAEVRDYRQSYPHFKCDIHHVLLRPTLKSVLADINNLVDEKVDWGSEERQQLESQILLANRPNLCLDPDNSICTVQARLNHNRQMWNTHRFRRAARKFSQATVNRKRKLDQFTYRPGLELYDYLSRTRTKPKTGMTTAGSSNIVTIYATRMQRSRPEEAVVKPVPAPCLDPGPIAPPSQGVFINELKHYPRGIDSSDCLPQLIEEYVLETDMPSKEKGKQRVYHIKLSILQRPSDLEFIGELYLDRDHKRTERSGVACRFSLGTRQNANRYIHQFTEIFTESGRKSVRIRYGLAGFKDRLPCSAQPQIQAAPGVQSLQNAQGNLAQQHLTHLTQTLQNQACMTTPMNGTVNPRITLVHQNQGVQNTSSVPILQSHLQTTTQIKPVSQASQAAADKEQQINALATKLMNSAQQYQAAVNAKNQQKMAQQAAVAAASNRNHTIINLLNSTPASSINNDASAAVVNAINNSSLLPQQHQVSAQKILAARKMTTAALSQLPNVSNARVLNHSNLIAAVSNNRLNLVDLQNQQQQVPQQQQRTITLTSVNSGGGYTNYTAVPIKPQQVQVNHQVRASGSAGGGETAKSTLTALLAGLGSADTPGSESEAHAKLMDKLAPAGVGSSSNCSVSSNSGQGSSSSHFIQTIKSGQLQYMVQSPPKVQNTVLSPLSSPPVQAHPQQTTNTINLAQLQSIPGLQNVQVQLSGFPQPISLSLNMSSAGGLQGHPSLLVSLPASTAGSSSNTMTQSSGNVAGGGVTSLGVTGPTVVLANAGASNIAQLVTSGVKGLAGQTLRAAGPGQVSLTQGGQQFQLLTPLQRPRLQQASIQQNLASRTIQRTPITIKMAAPNPNAAQVALPSANPPTLGGQLQKQAQYHQQQYQFLNQQQKATLPGVTGKLRRRSNASSDQQ